MSTQLEKIERKHIANGYPSIVMEKLIKIQETCLAQYFVFILLGLCMYYVYIFLNHVLVLCAALCLRFLWQIDLSRSRIWPKRVAIWYKCLLLLFKKTNVAANVFRVVDSQHKTSLLLDVAHFSSYILIILCRRAFSHSNHILTVYI